MNDVLQRESADTYYMMAAAGYKRDDFEDAIANFQKVITIQPEHAKAHYNLGVLFYQQDNVDAATVHFQRAIAIQPDYTDAYYNLGVLCQKHDDLDAAIAHYRKTLSLQPTYADAYYNLGLIFKTRDDLDEAIAHFQKAIEIKPDRVDAHIKCGDTLFDRNQVTAAIHAYEKALVYQPDNAIARRMKHLILPIFYENEAEISLWRQRFTDGLQTLINTSSLETEAEREKVLAILVQSTNFYLAYQGKDILELQCSYAQFLHRITAAQYPQWVQKLEMPTLSQGGKIRIGYVSPHLKNHNGAKWALGWLKNRDRQAFEVYSYFTGKEPDSTTQQFQQESDVFRHLDGDLTEVCTQIYADRLHILVFTDIGMHPQTDMLASLRLAPVQCNCWGHPVTSGSPNIDYYLSSDLMEPDNAQTHYSEKLIRLPNLGFCYPQPLLPQARKTRADFDLPDDAVIYLSCQSLFKYLPQYDDIFVGIAKRSPSARFVFICHHLSKFITTQFQQRLWGAFARSGLDAEQYCTILPRQVKTDDYLNLLLVADVYLDTPGWSGGNTTLEAIACGLTVVTLPGEFMRGRHSYAMLKILGIEETIAHTEADYIDIAVRLGEDLYWRQEIAQKMEENHAGTNPAGNCLYDDTTCMSALEAFYTSVVNPPDLNLNLDKWRKTAIAHHQAGQFADAEKLYEQILAYQPENTIVLNLLGTLACQTDRLELGIAKIQAALEINPNYVDANFNLGNAIRESGDLESALRQYQKTISLKPDHIEAYRSLGQVLGKQSKFQEAISNFQRAIALNPSYTEAYFDLAVTLYEQEDFEGAIAAYQKLITIAPNHFEVHNCLGVALERNGNSDEAIANFHQAIAINPNHAETYNNLGLALYNRGEFDLAISNYQKAIVLKPSLVGAYNNLGIVLNEMGKLDEAINNFRAALAIEPNYAEARYGLGAAHYEMGKLVEAINIFREAILIKPNYADAHFSFGAAHLSIGDFERGFSEYEWRLRGKNRVTLPSFTQPQWDGEDLNDKSILIQPEQGLGDQIQFVRYAPLIQERGGRIILVCDRLLLELFKTTKGIHELLTVGDPLPIFDVWVPIMSLPRILGTTLETIPNCVPYLFSSNANLFNLDREFPSYDRKLKVGLVWSSKPNHPTSARRSCPLNLLIQLLEIPNIKFYSLQKEASNSDWEILRQMAGRVTNLRQHLHDFAATAAIIDKLDLVITVDTAVAHLAGAMGKPVWVMLTFVPDWRWMLEGEDSIWYPTMRLFRQQQIGNWVEVVSRVGQALAMYTADNSHTPNINPNPTIKNTSPGAIMNLGVALAEQGKIDEAISLYHQAIQLNPNFVEAYNNLGNALLERGDFAAAITTYNQAIALNPEFAEAYLNIGTALSRQNDLEGATGNFGKAIALKPDFVLAHKSLGFVLSERGDLAGAIDSYQKAIALRPTHAELHKDLGMCLLLTGNFGRGLAEYEWRWQSDAFRTINLNFVPTFTQPLWDGSHLQGKTILLFPEQGLGDQIQFVRYAPLVQQRGGRVLLICHQLLLDLFKTAEGIDRLLSFGDTIPAFDTWAPLISLPHILRTTIETIPHQVPYLSDCQLEEGADRPRPIADRSFKVGFVWAIRQDRQTTGKRSCPLAIFQRLLDIPDIQFYSLQKEVTAEDLVLLGRYGDRIENLSDRLENFADTAGFVAQLDLVISVDTAVAHLAGAMGKPVWILLPFIPDWRWMLEREDTPWYPTMRLFRQKQIGDWEDVISRAIAVLKVLVEEKNYESKQPLPTSPQSSKINLGIAWSMGLTSGWGIFGMNLALQLLQNQEFKPFLVYPPALDDGPINPLHRSLLQPVIVEQQQFQTVLTANPTNQIQLDIPVIHSLSNQLGDFKSARVIGKKNFGFIFFEDTYLSLEKASAAHAYDAILAGSSWNTSVLKSYGIKNVYTALQGIDPTVFHPAPRSHLYGDRFVIFSGGKLEYRKGQDIAIAAFKAFRARHPDALLIAAWHNFWPQYMLGIEQTGNVVGLPAVGQQGQILIRAWLLENGLPEDSFIDIGVIPNHLTPQIIREADVALFPNRAEGGTNLVAMECLACGIPTILSANTGHLDLIGDYCYPLQIQRPVLSHPYFAGTAGWGESNVDEVVEILERIYCDREEAKRKGEAASIFMQDLTWEKQVNRILSVIKSKILGGNL
jgi:tetratricopeptide (TPR) repeat protein/glycosyltransferase involved in cell wall biosynthesis